MEIDMDIKSLVQSQRDYFNSGATLDVRRRIESLNILQKSIKDHENEICIALKRDLGKDPFEGYMCEVGLAMSEITYMIRHAARFAQEKHVSTPLAQFPAKSYVKPSPYGTTLIISPWNYPFLLCIEPLSNAIAAGNTAIIKPSAYAPHTSEIVCQIIKECFDSRYVACITGGRSENTELLEQKFDFIFFTGSTNVGKVVLSHAAEYLTPVVLELGGKSPCIVDASADVDLAAKRIVFGKFINAGQTCIAPDYILCVPEIKNELICALKDEIERQYPDYLNAQYMYGSIVNKKHFDRIVRLIDVTKVVYGGQSDASLLRIQPTILDNVTWDDAVMQEEIFGPLLPIVTFDTYDGLIARFHSMPKPLALYIFAKDTHVIDAVTTQCQFGGGCVNDTIIHLATTNMGFGGVGESGMGSYHGKAGFNAFSHTKSIIQKRQWLDLPMRYRPYTNTLYKNLVRLFLR